jgi:hypothetical protein
VKSNKVLRMIGIAAVVLALCSVSVAEVHAQNLVENGGFESGATGWTEWDSPGTWTTDVFLHTYYTECVGAIFVPDPCVYAGSRSYRQERGTRRIHGGIYQVINVVPGEKYEVSGYWRGGVGGTGSNDKNDIAWFEVTVYQGTVGAAIIDAPPGSQDVVIAKKEYTGLTDTVKFDWEPFSDSPWLGGDGTFVADGNTVTLAIKVGKVGKWNYMAGYLDKISVEAVRKPVGGEAYPVNGASVLAPWIAAAVLLVAGAGWLALRRRRARS